MTDLVDTFRQGLARGQLLLQACNGCGKAIMYPRHRCPFCQSDDLDWRTSAGEGVLHSKADHSYGYSDALRDGVVRPVVFLAYSGQASWRTSAGEEFTARLGEPLTHARHLKEVAAIVRPHWIRLRADASDKVLRIGRNDELADALLAHRRLNPHYLLLAGQRAHAFLLPATKFPARSNESNVPASVHQPSRCAYVMVPSRMYALFTSVISNSPRPDGTSFFTLSNTVSSYM